jgi:hypothetical protein
MVFFCAFKNCRSNLEKIKFRFFDNLPDDLENRERMKRIPGLLFY